MDTDPDFRSQRKPYGDELAANYGLQEATHIVTRVLQHAEIAVTELWANNPPVRVSDPIPPEDAYLVCCQLQTREPFEYWEDGRSLGACSLRGGETSIRDLQRNPQAMTHGPLHSILWYVPRATLNALADEAGAAIVAQLRYEPRVGIADETIRHLSAAMLPALRTPDQVNRLFSDHVSAALAAHLAHTYGDLRVDRRIARGWPVTWQERRAKEMLAADLTGATPLAEIAATCGLSRGHFARAFRKSVGLAPHAWLLKARVDHAMELLRRPSASLSEIALACGFADHSHFSRVFGRLVGVTPRDWRRLSIR